MVDVGRSAYLTRRKGSSSWYYRRRLPPDVAVIGRRTDFWLSLRTGNLDEAKRGLSDAEELYWEAVSQARGETAPSHRRIEPRAKRPARLSRPSSAPLGVEDARMLARSYFRAELGRLDLALPLPLTGDEAAQQLLDAGTELSVLENPDHPDADIWTEEAELALLASAGFSATPDSEASRLLRTLLHRAMVQLVALRAERARGNFRDQITDRFFTRGEPDAARRRPVPAGKTLSDLIADYDRAKIEPEDTTEKTKKKARATLDVVKKHFGGGTWVHSVDREMCYGFRDVIAALPPNFTKKLRPRLTLAALAEDHRRRGGSLLSRATQASYLRALFRLFEFAKEQKLVPENVAENIPVHAPKRRKRERLRNSYSPEQLRKIFNAPIYQGCKGDGAGVYKAGTKKIRDARFWLPLIALFSGLRMNEILQLTPDHVDLDEDGHPYFRVDDHMQVKTDNSYRVVPVHPELIRIGLVAFIDSKRRSGAELLFGDVKPGLDGYRSTRFSKTYSRLVKHLNVEEPGRKVSFHSFRHNFRDALRLPDVNQDLVRELGGWSRGDDTSTSYGDGARAAALRPLVERIQYDLDLSHLYPEGTVDGLPEN